jgi:hypothetical protein
MLSHSRLQLDTATPSSPYLRPPEDLYLVRHCRVPALSKLHLLRLLHFHNRHLAPHKYERPLSSNPHHFRNPVETNK